MHSQTFVALLVFFIASCVIVDTGAQLFPFNITNFTIPLERDLDCSANNTNPGLSWCKWVNPYVLSDFLSRNSTDLTTRGTSSSSVAEDSGGNFTLSIYCDGELVNGTGFGDEGINSICTAIQAIQAGSFGIVANNTEADLTNFIVFVDLSGQLLFVYFNNNSMANSMKIEMTNINNFDVTSIQNILMVNTTVSSWNSLLNRSETSTVPRPEIVQDMVLFITNKTTAGLVKVDGVTSRISKPCYLFNFNLREVEFAVESAQFFPSRSTTADDIVSISWAVKQNYSQTLMYFENVTNPPAWTFGIYYYNFYAVPSTQRTTREYIEECPPNKLPLGIQLWVQLYSFDELKFLTMHNRASNMSFMVAYSTKGVTFYRISYSGSYDQNQFEQMGTYLYEWTVKIVVDWCQTRTVLDPTVNETVNVTRSRNTMYCVPTDDTVIDNVELVSPDTFSNIGNYSKDVWLVIALRNRTTSWIHVMSLTELTYISNRSLSTPRNPLNLPDTFGTPEYPCNFETEAIYESSPGVYQCQPRVTADFILPNGSPVTDIVARVIGTRSTTTTGNTSSSNFNQYIGPDSSDYSLIFVSQGTSVNVFAMFSELESNGQYFGLRFQDYNHISFQGNVSSMYVSDNGMHLLTTISRHSWELTAQNRYKTICDTIAHNKSDPFLVPAFGAACAAQAPQEVNLNAFTQYASYCAFNTYCPSLDQLTVKFPPDSYYADRPAVIKICPKGFFCMAGQKIPCPQGFYCDVEGLSQPKRCGNPVNSNFTCAMPGLIVPAPCAEGTVCTLPHIPGLPAPPGYMVPAPPLQRSNFVPCPAGLWCPLGAQVAYPNSTVTNTTFVCPANTFCGEASDVEPHVCQCEGSPLSITTANGSTIICGSSTLYCPAGSVDVVLCPAGTYCTMPNLSTACIPTQYCPPGTFAPSLCPPGQFCETPSVSAVCPSGHFCPEGTVVPQPCNFLTVCPEGSAAQSRSFLVLFVVVFVVAGVLIGFCVFTWYEKKKQSEAETVAIMSPEVRDYLTSAGLDDEEEEEQKPLSSRLTMSIPTSRFQTPTIRFEGMGLTLQVGEAKGKVVLDNVTGTIPPGSFVAVMGPSGSGKSTFMHTLAGKAFYGTRSGHVYINDDEVDLNQFSKIVGFVKQDDIMHRELTVFETLLFNARMRYDPLGMDSPEAISNAMLKALDLNHVRGTPIGDEKKRGVSGGQRKRVNIGMELVALPSILFLDEPTSGLDSSSSMSVCSALREMANVGITVIAVIHQPRYEIFNMFHRVLLLAKGGKLVYYGPPNDALKYFEEHIGIKCPPHVNPPDFFMDVISGETNEMGMSIDDMVTKWQEYQNHCPTVAVLDGKEPSDVVTTRRTSVLNSSNDGKDIVICGNQLAKEAGKKEIAGFFNQLRLFTIRSVVQLSRDLMWFFTDLVLVFVSGFFLGLVFSNSEYRPPLPEQIVNRSLSAFGNSAPPMLAEFFDRPVDDPIISEASLTCMAIGMTGVTAALRVFGTEQIVYWREASAGMSTTAYFLAKNISHIFFIVLSPLLYLAPFLTFVAARASFWHYYRVLILVQFTTTGLGYLVSIVVPGGLAQLAGVVVVLVFSMFGGARPTLVEIKKMFILLQAMPYISYIRWAQEAVYLEEISVWNTIEGVNIAPSLTLFGYSLDDYDLCVLLTVVFGVIFRVLALIAMQLMHRDQKH